MTPRGPGPAGTLLIEDALKKIIHRDGSKGTKANRLSPTQQGYIERGMGFWSPVADRLWESVTHRPPIDDQRQFGDAHHTAFNLSLSF